MPRPRKDGRLRMDTDLRIPLTSEQKALIVEATQGEPEGMAAWARAILLLAARDQIVRKGAEKPPRKKGKRGEPPAPPQETPLQSA